MVWTVKSEAHSQDSFTFENIEADCTLTIRIPGAACSEPGSQWVRGDLPLIIETRDSVSL